MRNMVDRINYLEKIVQKNLRISKQSLAHRWDHIKRVHDLSIKLAKEYNSIDLEVLRSSALLHDIEQPFDDKKNHQKKSAKKAKKILKSIGYPKEFIDKVYNIIIEHSSENGDIHLSSLESKILFDADKIDGVDAIGIARAFILCGQQGKNIDECLKWYQYKIKRVLPYLQTEEGKKIALQKLKFVNEFIKRIESDISKS